jgi:hypothetical protein
VPVSDRPSHLRATPSSEAGANLTAGHQELLKIQERYLQTNSQKSRARNVGKLARGHIEEHIARLQEIKKQIAGKLLPARTRQREPSKPVAP